MKLQARELPDKTGNYIITLFDDNGKAISADIADDLKHAIDLCRARSETHHSCPYTIRTADGRVLTSESE